MQRPQFTNEQIEWIDAKFRELKTRLKGKMIYAHYMEVLPKLNEFYAMVLLDTETINEGSRAHRLVEDPEGRN